jgi:2-isopropylmalate synthase
MTIEIYDCTLREGEQSDGASFSFEDRINLAKKLDEFGVDYIEIGWPIVSQEIFDSVKEAIKNVKRAKIVAFGSTSIRKDVETDENLKSIIDSGAKYACIFGKTNEEHVIKQLKIDWQENLKKIHDSIKYLKNNGLTVFYDAEHYFDSYKIDNKKAIETLVAAINAGAERIILCDTNGGTMTNESKEIVKETALILTEKELVFNLGVHFHNDLNLALPNTIESLPYVVQVQGTINGIGERLGNLNFSEFLPLYMILMKQELDIELIRLKDINEFAYKASGVNIPENRPFVGESAFLHKAGVHIDAQLKGASYEHSKPEIYGNKTTFLLNSLGGRNSIVKIANEHGFKIDKNNNEHIEKIKKIITELKNLETKGYRIGALKAEQYLLFDKYFNNNQDNFKIVEWSINSENIAGKEKSRFLALIKVENETIEGTLELVGGPIDAAFKTLKKLLKEKYDFIENLKLTDFHVGIARQKKRRKYC